MSTGKNFVELLNKKNKKTLRTVLLGTFHLATKSGTIYFPFNVSFMLLCLFLHMVYQTNFVFSQFTYISLLGIKGFARKSLPKGGREKIHKSGI